LRKDTKGEGKELRGGGWGRERQRVTRITNAVSKLKIDKK